jgi:threonylcarbamoyladenosine tRNA methylthiotransferase MtaB
MKIFLDSIGCRLNQSEIEHMAAEFVQAGHQLCDSPLTADTVVINTCSVTAGAAADSRSAIRRHHRAHPGAAIVLTGCWSTMAPQAAAALPGVRCLIPNASKDRLVSQVLKRPVADFDREPVGRHPVPGLRLRTRAFIKAQDGCDNHCTFCLTTLARGPARSLPPQVVLSGVQAAAEAGVQEAVLSGVELGAYGMDLGDQWNLSCLIQLILRKSVIPRLRLSSLEPWHLSPDFFALWEDPRLCRQLHLPLQSGSGATLRRMGRPIRPLQYARLVEWARRAIPAVAITTDLIAGFPGETEQEFTESLAFIRAMDFSAAHVFTYSPRPGTAASRMPSQLPKAERRSRSRLLRQATRLSADAYRNRFVGSVLQVLWESAGQIGPQGWRMSGLADNYIRVEALAERDLWNTLSSVKIEAVAADGLNGRIIRVDSPEGARTGGSRMAAECQVVPRR